MLGCPELQVPKDHLARQAIEWVAELDTTMLLQGYSSLGRRVRALRPPTPGEFDFQLEVMGPFGRSRANSTLRAKLRVVFGPGPGTGEQFVGQTPARLTYPMQHRAQVSVVRRLIGDRLGDDDLAS